MIGKSSYFGADSATKKIRLLAVTGALSVFLGGGICTKVGICSYSETYEKDWSSSFLIWAATKKHTQGAHCINFKSLLRIWPNSVKFYCVLEKTAKCLILLQSVLAL
jgi:hypothetical protein